MHGNNKTYIDLAKVQYGTFYWKNQEGMMVQKKPKVPSVRGEFIEEKRIAGYHPDYPGETMRERALRLGIIDHWTPVVIFMFASNHGVTYVGKKATEMWEAWKFRCFRKGTKV